MHAGDDAPGNHLDGNPTVGAESFGDELGWQFGAEKAEEEDCLARVVVVRVHVQVVEHVVGQGLGDVAAIELQGEEHEARPGADAQIQLRGSGVFG